MDAAYPDGQVTTIDCDLRDLRPFERRVLRYRRRARDGHLRID